MAVSLKSNCLPFGLREQLIARRIVIFLVELVERQARVQPANQLGDILVPKLDIRIGSTDVLLAVPDHLVRDLTESRHALGVL